MMAGQHTPEVAVTKQVEPVETVTGEIVLEGEGEPGTEIEPFVSENGDILLAGPAALRLRALLTTIPVDDESANERIVDQLLSGGSITDLNRPWDATGGRQLAGKTLRINSIKGRPSRFQAGLRAFLVAECTDTLTGEPVVMTTSALAVVVQLARVANEGWLPAFATVEVADRPTERGFYPYHLRFLPPGQVA